MMLALVCCGLTSLRRDAQQVCLIFHTTAATRSSDRKQLERKRVNVNVDSPQMWEHESGK